jgi:hypothetical protein
MTAAREADWWSSPSTQGSCRVADCPIPPRFRRGDSIRSIRDRSRGRRRTTVVGSVRIAYREYAPASVNDVSGVIVLIHGSPVTRKTSMGWDRSWANGYE